MREFFVQKLDPEIGSLFLLHSFSECGILIYRTYVLSYSLIGGDHIQMKIQQNMSTDGKTYDSTQTLQNTMSPARQAVWTAVVTASALATPFPVGSVILFPQMGGVFPFSRFYLQTNVFLTALTARIIVTPMSGGLPLPRRKSAN
mgnify:CR=1 FL=1